MASLIGIVVDLLAATALGYVAERASLDASPLELTVRVTNAATFVGRMAIWALIGGALGTLCRAYRNRWPQKNDMPSID
jgi:uncharacterized membrane protein (DUF441 family)